MHDACEYPKPLLTCGSSRVGRYLLPYLVMVRESVQYEAGRVKPKYGYCRV